MPNWTEADLARARPLAKRPKPTGRIRVKGMNKTETSYGQYLDLLKLDGEVIWWGFEALKLRIGDNCWYSPDFLVMYSDNHLELHDTKAPKGHPGAQTYRAEDDAIVKARSTGANFPVPMYFVWREHTGDWAKREM